MQRNGNPGQWIDGYPQEEVVLRDLADGHLFVGIGSDEVGEAYRHQGEARFGRPAEGILGVGDLVSGHPASSQPDRPSLKHPSWQVRPLLPPRIPCSRFWACSAIVLGRNPIMPGLRTAPGPMTSLIMSCIGLPPPPAFTALPPLPWTGACNGILSSGSIPIRTTAPCCTFSPRSASFAAASSMWKTAPRVSHFRRKFVKCRYSKICSCF